MALKNLKKKTAPEEAPKKKAVTGEAESGKSWFMEGSAGFDRKAKLDHLSQMRKEKGVPRFFLKQKAEVNPETGAKSNEARVVFLDSSPFFVFEHNLALEGRWGNMFTCVKDFGPCAICEQTGDKPTYTAYLTVIDTRRWPKKDGTVSKARKVLFPAKGVAMDKIKELLESNKGDLRGLVVDIKRLGDKDPNCGRDFTVKGKFNEAKLREKFDAETIQPFKYKTVLARPTDDELIAAGIKAVVPAGSEADISSDTSGGDEEDMKALLDD